MCFEDGYTNPNCYYFRITIQAYNAAKSTGKIIEVKPKEINLSQIMISRVQKNAIAILKVQGLKGTQEITAAINNSTMNLAIATMNN